MFFRRRVVERLGALDERLQYCMDYEYWLRLAMAGARFARIDRKLAGSRMHAQNKTLSQTVKVHAEANRMLYDRLGHVPDVRLMAYAVAVAEGRVERAKHPVLFKIDAGLRSIIQALRWNRSISREMRDRVLRDVFGHG